MVIEIRDPDFEFLHNKQPTGHYARGNVIKEDNSTYEVELFFNGKKYIVDKNICKEII